MLPTAKSPPSNGLLQTEKGQKAVFSDRFFVSVFRSFCLSLLIINDLSNFEIQPRFASEGLSVAEKGLNFDF